MGGWLAAWLGQPAGSYYFHIFVHMFVHIFCHIFSDFLLASAPKSIEFLKENNDFHAKPLNSLSNTTLFAQKRVEFQRKTRFSELAGGLAGFPTPWRAYCQAGRQAKSIKFLKENLVFGAWLAPWLAGQLAG